MGTNYELHWNLFSHPSLHWYCCLAHTRASNQVFPRNHLGLLPEHLRCHKNRCSLWVVTWPHVKTLRNSTAIYLTITNNNNSVALVRERTIPTERLPPVGEVSANFCGKRGVTWSARRIPTAVNLCFLDRSRYFFYSSSSSIDLMRLSGPRSRPTTTQKIW